MKFWATDEWGAPNSREELDHETGCFNVVCVNAKGSGSGGSTDLVRLEVQGQEKSHFQDQL